MDKTKERPIILTAEEVNAVLAGDKTQHRVPVLTAKEIDEGFEWDFSAEGDSAVCIKEIDDERQEVLLKPCPFGAIGDRLWVQELHARTEHEYRLTRTHYYADGNLRLDLRHDAGLLTKYSAADMPRWASRLLLEITDIRIERVNDITHSDSIAEYCFNFGEKKKQCIPPLTGFCSYWREKHGDDAWRSNPWVWVIEFKVIKETSNG